MKISRSMSSQQNQSCSKFIKGAGSREFKKNSEHSNFLNAVFYLVTTSYESSILLDLCNIVAYFTSTLQDFESILRQHRCHDNPQNSYV